MKEKKHKTVDEFFKSFDISKDYVYYLYFTTAFKKNVKLCYKRNLDLNLLETAIKTLAKEGILPPEYKAHPLKGYKKKGNEEIMECHIRPDWILIWIQNNNKLTLVLTDTGTHADLFGM